MAEVVDAEILDRVRAAAAGDPVSAALVELRVVYQASYEQIAGLRAADLGDEIIRFPAAAPGEGRTAGPATEGRRIGLTLVPTVGRALAALRTRRQAAGAAGAAGARPQAAGAARAGGEGATAPLLGEDVAALRARVDALLARAGAPPGALLAPTGACAEMVLHVSETEHGLLTIIRDGVGLWALTETIAQGVRFASGEPSPQFGLWSHLDPFLPPRPRVLLLGGGVFLGARRLEERLAPSRLDVLEWDPRCARLARLFFDWEPGPATVVHEGDAIAFVHAAAATPAGARWDAILYDLADRDGTSPHVRDPAFAAACAALAPVLAMNLIGVLGGEPLAAARASLAGAGLGWQRVVPLRSTADTTLRQGIFLIASRTREADAASVAPG